MRTKIKQVVKTGALLSALVVCSQASASLIVRDGGMVYDDVLDITWLQDANYAKTSGYDANGLMTWDESITWADSLVYGGYDDWRLFNGAYDDTNCSSSYKNPDLYFGSNCTASELGHVFYEDFNLAADQSIEMATGEGLNNLNLFKNVQNSSYWSGSTFSWMTNTAGFFTTLYGAQSIAGTSGNMYAWAVRDGDVAGGNVSEVPEPTSLAIFGLGLLGLGIRRTKKQ